MAFIKHIGVPRRSGRYPWGSGKDPQQRGKSFLGYVSDLRKQGLSEVEIAKGMGMTTLQLRAKKTLEIASQRKADAAEAFRLEEKGLSRTAIAERMGRNESSIRSLLDPTLQERSAVTETISNVLKDNVVKKKYIDIGAGVEQDLGVSREKLNAAVASLEAEGYTPYYVKVEQVGTGKYTTLKTLAAPGTTYSEVYKNRDQIKTITDYSEDSGRTFLGLEPIKSVSSDRIKIRYKEEGGGEKDGVIELRKGVDDLSLGNSNYAQVRIGVDGSHYLKGMAVYGENLPDGVDIIYNTTKHLGTPPQKVFKPMEVDQKTGEIDTDNPFGSTIKRQRHYVDKNGNKHLSAINTIDEEGDWSEWSKSLSSQMLSKQSPAVAKKQLGLAYDAKKEEFDEIMALTNPVVKKNRLDSFADDCDASAVHLKAAALPRQGSYAILPIPSLKDTEIFAPNFRNGEPVVLIRHPHGGIFEIPQLTVNNLNVEANKLIPGAKDAVGINHKVASVLSGADFDGDTVLVIPNKSRTIKTSSPLKGLKDFDPKESYPGYPGMKVMSDVAKGAKMGDISNLITDMSIKGASEDEICRAVRHSMVVIDAKKHSLNYKQSYIDNGIGELKKKYQGSEKAGAATLISRSASTKRVSNRKEVIDPETGEKSYIYPGQTYTTKKGEVRTFKGDTYVNKKGVTVSRLEKSTKMAETSDAFKLSSGTQMETVYATHANQLKSLANLARKQSASTKNTPYSPSAKKTYDSEVRSLTAKLNIALRNAPLERQAQLLANKIVSTKKQNNPDMDPATVKKIKGQALNEARIRSGAKKTKIVITDNEWKAIQAGAISTNTLTKILNNADSDQIKKLATPRTATKMTPSKVARAKTMKAAGYTTSQIADHLGVSPSTLNVSLK